MAHFRFNFTDYSEIEFVFVKGLRSTDFHFSHSISLAIPVPLSALVQLLSHTRLTDIGFCFNLVAFIFHVAFRLTIEPQYLSFHSAHQYFPSAHQSFHSAHQLI